MPAAPARDLRLPAGACDCHMHIFGDPARFPLRPDRSYTPGQASVGDYRALQRRYGLERVVVVQPSVYGTDNSCLLDALAQFGATGRGVAVIDAATTAERLGAMHGAGVRGVRINAVSSGRIDGDALRNGLARTARQVEELGWHVQLFAGLDAIAALERDLATLRTPVVIDHMGLADAGQGAAQPGLRPLIRLLEAGAVWVKLSGHYRVSDAAPAHADAIALANALYGVNPERVVWGSDWPHTPHHSGTAAASDAPLPFRDENPIALLEGLDGGADALRRLLSDNPARLYGFSVAAPQSRDRSAREATPN